MSQQVSHDDPVGRSKHLGKLALIFKHRHATWRHFADFLRHEFMDDTEEGPMTDATRAGLASILCRHNSGGRHHAALLAARTGAFQEAFGHVRFQRPCVTHGTYDEKKNPGLVVDDLCRRAVQFLFQKGLGDVDEETRRDFEYDPENGLTFSDSEDSLPPVDSRDLEGIDVGNITLHQSRFVGKQPRNSSSGREEFFQDEDVQDIEQHTGSLDFDLNHSVSAPGMESSQDSVGQGASNPGRKTTKMRAATLAYLWGFVNDPQTLRNEFRRLRVSPHLHVLHLCGCGLCYKTDKKQRVFGCCEASHLVLGPSTLNNRHRTYHQMLDLIPPHLYETQVAIIRQAEDSSNAGVF